MATSTTQTTQSQTTTTLTADKSIPIPRGPVTASLEFYEPPTDGSTPFYYVEDPPAGQPKSNFGSTSLPISISDLRGHESNFTLDRNAFAALSHIPSAAHPQHDFAQGDAHIRQTYYPEVTQLLLDTLPGAHKVVLFDHTIRREGSDPSVATNRAPVTRVHVDQTPASAAQRVRLHVADPEEAEKLLAGRYRIVNVWRPLNVGPVVSFPLAMADSATVRDEDLVGVEHRYPDRTGATAGVKFNEAQRWWYWSGMTDGERLLLKCFDSDEELGRYGRVPHTAFVDPRTPEGAPQRESIEVRALVFG